MSSITHVLLFDLNLDETAKYIMTTLKYRNIVSNIASVMMIPVPEFVFADGLPPLKGRRCACVTINCWSDSEVAYEVVSELKKNGKSSIPHIGGLWTVKIADEAMLKLLMEMAGDFRWALDYNPSIISSDAASDITDEDEYEEVNNKYIDNSYGYEDMNDSDSEVARIFPEENNFWKTVSADGYTMIDVGSKTFPGWENDAPSPIPEPPKLVRYSMNCTKDDCNLCIPLENNYNYNHLYVQ